MPYEIPAPMLAKSVPDVPDAVFGLRNSRCPICGLVSPSAMSSST